MDIVSRLKIFLQENGISNSLFADNCGIPRPTLSQLLNGRNKKVSDELIAKIHSAYPALNVMWLMFGDGDMFVPNANMPAGDRPAQPVENSIEFGEANNASQGGTRSTTISFGGGVDRGDFRDQRSVAAAKQSGPTPESMHQPMGRAANLRVNPRAASAAGESRVVSITVFYSDGRFETFVPQE